MVHIEGQFVFPTVYNLTATFLFALTGSILAIKRGYDLVGVAIMSLIVGVGSSLIRDGIFLNNGPPLIILDSRYIIAVALAVLVGSLAFKVAQKFDAIFFIADALGLGIYAIIGTQMSLNAGLTVVSAILIGFSSVIGGTILRDVLIRREPVVFFPGNYYALAAIVGIGTFLILAVTIKINANAAAIAAIGLTFIIRLASVQFNLQSKPVADYARVNISSRQLDNLKTLVAPIIKKSKSKKQK